MNVRPRCAALLATALLAGCAASSTLPLMQARLKPKPSTCQIAVFAESSQVERPYVAVALLTHRTKPDAFSDKDAVAITKALRVEACRAGADAIIVRHLLHGSWCIPGLGEALAIVYGGPAGKVGATATPASGEP